MIRKINISLIDWVKTFAGNNFCDFANFLDVRESLFLRNLDFLSFAKIFTRKIREIREISIQNHMVTKVYPILT